MVILAYILAIIAWWISTVVLDLVLQTILMVVLSPLFLFTKRARLLREVEMHGPDANTDLSAILERKSFLLDDVLHTAILVATQIVAFLAGEWIFRLCGLQASRWLALPFGLLCLLCLVSRGNRWAKLYGEMGRHHNWCWRIGLTIGWLIGTFGLL
jgi:hypothetical protein